MKVSSDKHHTRKANKPSLTKRAARKVAKAAKRAARKAADLTKAAARKVAAAAKATARGVSFAVTVSGYKIRKLIKRLSSAPLAQSLTNTAKTVYSFVSNNFTIVSVAVGVSLFFPVQAFVGAALTGITYYGLTKLHQYLRSTGRIFQANALENALNSATAAAKFACLGVALTVMAITVALAPTLMLTYAGLFVLGAVLKVSIMDLEAMRPHDYGAFTAVTTPDDLEPQPTN